nr:AAA family ATPase [Crateriforma conspicua]
MTSKGSLRVMTGVAGAGKSTAIDAIRDAFERSGHRVLGTAMAGKAANELSDRGGIETRTVASYLHHLDRSKAGRVADRVRHEVRMLTRALRKKNTWRHERVKIPKKSVLIIDEAGMLDTRTLSRLLHHCEKHKATVVLTGDSQQLPPILAGGPLDHLVDKTGETKLTENRRQQDAADRDAVKKFRDGEIEEAIKDYAKRNRLTLGHDTDQAKELLVQSWRNNNGHKRPAKHLILTQTREDANDINQRCQRERIKSRRIVPGLSIKHGQSRFFIGDRVSFHQPMRKHGIENGHAGTVIAVDPITRKVTVRLDRRPSKKQKSMGITQTERISLLGLDKDAIRLGYASTTHRAQGTTTEKSYVLMSGPMMSREITYTQLTRARDATRLFVDSSTAGKDLKKLIQSVSRSRRKDLAHDHKRETKRPNDEQPSRQGSRRSKTIRNQHKSSPNPDLEIDGGSL